MTPVISRIALLSAAIGLFCATQAQGATLNVGSGQPHATISSALTAAGSGDTILIVDDSTTYTENLTIDKPVTILATGSPIIAGTVRTANGAGGARVGSFGDGLITLNGAGLSTDAITLAHNDTTPIIFENLEIRNFANSGSQLILPIAPGYADFLFIDADCGKSAFWLPGATTSASGGSYNFSQCRFVGTRLQTFVIQQVCTINFTSCEIASAPTSANATPVLSSFFPSTLTFENCWIYMGGVTTSTPVVEYRIGSNMRFDRCVIVGTRLGFKFRVDAHTGSIFRMDHCDIINPVGYNCILIQNSTTAHSSNRTFSITNTNLNALGEGRLGISYAVGTGDVWETLNYNNYWGTTGAYDATIPTAAIGANNISTGDPALYLGVDPNYVSPSTGDFTVQNPAIQTAGSAGSTIGANVTYANLVPVEISTFQLN